MAVKAVGYIQSVTFEADATLTVRMRIADPTHMVDDVAFTGVAPGFVESTLNTDLKDYIKTYAETNFGTTFGVLDTARLLNKFNVL